MITRISFGIGQDEDPTFFTHFQDLPDGAIRPAFSGGTRSA